MLGSYESQRAKPEKQRRRASFKHLLEERYQKGLEAHEAVRQGQPIGVARQPVKRFVVRPDPGVDALGPVAVELHIAATWLDER